MRHASKSNLITLYLNALWHDARVTEKNNDSIFVTRNFMPSIGNDAMTQMTKIVKGSLLWCSRAIYLQKNVAIPIDNTHQDQFQRSKNMGRNKIEVDDTKLITLRAEGKSVEQISTELAVSPSTLDRRMRYLRFNEKLLTKYNELRHLRITEFAEKILDSLEGELPFLSVDQRIKLLGVLSRDQSNFKGKEPKQGTGLVDILMKIENEDKEGKAANKEWGSCKS